MLERGEIMYQGNCKASFYLTIWKHNHLITYNNLPKRIILNIFCPRAKALFDGPLILIFTFWIFNWTLKYFQVAFKICKLFQVYSESPLRGKILKWTSLSIEMNLAINWNEPRHQLKSTSLSIEMNLAINWNEPRHQLKWTSPSIEINLAINWNEPCYQLKWTSPSIEMNLAIIWNEPRHQF